jgi:hypothetical protein
MAGNDAGPEGGERRAPGPSAVPGAPGGVPQAVLRSWDQAEARLFPLVLADPGRYETALGAISRLLARLRESSPDLPALLAAHERSGSLAEEPVPGVSPDLIAAGACAMRYREIVAIMAAERRLEALARARDQDLAWTVVGENGEADRAPYVPYQRIEAQTSSGRAVIVSIEPDETLSRAVYRLEAGQVDLASGSLRIGELIGSYLDGDEFEAALRQVRGAGPAGPAE